MVAWFSRKPEAPVPQRLGIMTPHHLHIGDFQASPVGRANELFNRWQIAAGNMYFVNQRLTGAALP